MKNPKKMPRSESATVHLNRSLRFQNFEQLELAKKAAAQRGWSLSSFAVRAVELVARHELGLPVNQTFWPELDAPSKEQDAA